MAEVVEGSSRYTFSRFCWGCWINKEAPGGSVNKRTKMWFCSSCSKREVMEWRKGTPPSIGWWPTRHFLNAHQGAYRWWDGEQWSWPAFAHESAEKAAHWAAKKEYSRTQEKIEWAERPADWPDRSMT